VGLAALLAEATEITDEDFLVAAQALASFVSADRLAVGCCYPEINQIREASKHIAVTVAPNIFTKHRSALSAVQNDGYWMKKAEEIMYVPRYEEYK
jgi:malic enzyme